MAITYPIPANLTNAFSVSFILILTMYFMLGNLSQNKQLISKNLLSQLFIGKVPVNDKNRKVGESHSELQRSENWWISFRVLKSGVVSVSAEQGTINFQIITLMNVRIVVNMLKACSKSLTFFPSPSTFCFIVGLKTFFLWRLSVFDKFSLWNNFISEYSSFVPRISCQFFNYVSTVFSTSLK